MPPLILASTSRYRRQLLERLGLPFETVAPEVSEAHVPGELPADRALRLSLEKARDVATRRPGALVIGADQVATAGERVLDKPGNPATARAQLGALSGRSAQFFTACTVHDGAAAVHWSHLDTTTVVFRPLSEAEIERYVAREQPYDCAGGFRAEALGVALFECIESQDPTGLIGLPLIWLAAALRRAGCRLP